MPLVYALHEDTIPLHSITAEEKIACMPLSTVRVPGCFLNIGNDGRHEVSSVLGAVGPPGAPGPLAIMIERIIMLLCFIYLYLPVTSIDKLENSRKSVYIVVKRIMFTIS